MSKPIIAIVGRPNVGKSTLFNALAGEKISIVKDTPGVTRDRIYADVTWLNYQFTLIDTGGIEPDSGDLLLSHMRGQAEIAMETADVIIFLTDVRQGLVDADYQVADMLRRSGKPIVLAVNKVDNYEKFVLDTYEFYNLGLGTPFPVSANSKIGFGDLLDEVLVHCNPQDADEKEDERPRVAIIGKPNAGKSSLINKLLGEDRLIVSDIAGTTRDVVEGSVTVDGILLNMIDTAGIRETEDIVEKIGVERSREKIQEADLVLLVLDSSRELDDEDKEIIDSVGDKKCVVILNKIDLESKIDENIISNFDNIIKISAKEEIGLGDLKNTIKDLFFSGKIDTESLIISNSRHKQALFRALENAEMALSKVRMNEYLDLISIFVTSALRALNEITGDELEEDLVNKIFGDFCVGK